MDFEFDPKDTLFVRIDRRRKLPASILLRSLGYTSEQIIETFFDNVDVTITDEGFTMTLVPSRLRGETATFDIVDQKGKVLVEEGRRVTARHIKQMEKIGLEHLPAYGNEVIFLLQATSLVSTITILDLTGISRQLISKTFAEYECYLTAAAMYLVMTYALVYLFRVWEKRMSGHLQERVVVEAR